MWKKIKKLHWCVKLFVLIDFVIIGCFIFVYGPIDYAKVFWITTSMETANHQYLANIFYNEAIPASEQMSHWVQGFVRDWPITFVISYFAAFVAEYCGKLAAKKYAGNS